MKKLIASVIIGVGLIATPAFAAEKAVEQLNELLRGELSAVETYRQALEKVGNEPGASNLRSFRDNHQAAADRIRQEIQKLGGVPSTDSGAWGTWAKTVMGSAKIFGDEAALKALKEGEEHGISEYKETLENQSVPSEFKTIIQNTYLPNQNSHIAEIDRMMKRM